MSNIPDLDVLAQSRTEGEFKSLLIGPILNVLAELIGGAAVTELTIASGQITPTGATHTVDTENDTASDDLNTLVTTNHPAGRVLILSCADNSRNVVLKHGAGGTGQMLLMDLEDVTLTDTKDRVFFQLIGTDWHELFRVGPSWTYEPANEDLLKRNVSAVLTKGFPATAAAMVTDSPTPATAALQTISTSAGDVALGTPGAAGVIRFIVTGTGALNPSAAYDSIDGTYDTEVAMAQGEIVSDGTHHFLTIVNGVVAA